MKHKIHSRMAFLGLASSLMLTTVKAQWGADSNCSLAIYTQGSVYTEIPYWVQVSASFWEMPGYYDINGSFTFYKDNKPIDSVSAYGSVYTNYSFVEQEVRRVNFYASGYDERGGYGSASCYVDVNYNYKPMPTISVDRYANGTTITCPRAGSVSITVRFAATHNGNYLTGIRPQVWRPDGSLDNNGGNFVPQSGGGGEVTWTVALNQPGQWRFWTDARDSNGNETSSGAWNSGFVINVYWPPVNGLPEIFLDAVATAQKDVPFSINASAISDNGNHATGMRVMETRRDISGAIYQPPVEIIYIPLSANQTIPSFSTTRIGTRAGTITYHIYAWNEGCLKQDSDGNWTLDEYQVPPRVHEVTIPNTRPTVTWVPSDAQIIHYGQSLTITAIAEDKDGDLWHFVFDAGTPTSEWNWQVGYQPWWAGIRTEYAAPGVAGPVSGQGTIHPHEYGGNPIGEWRMGFNVTDHCDKTWEFQDGATQYTAVTVEKTTPLGAFTDRIISNTNTGMITQAHLDAVFTNPYNPSLQVSGGISYSIVESDSPSLIVGTVVAEDTALPAGRHIVRATLEASQNYNSATIYAVFTVGLNPDDDDNGNGILNGIESKLGLDPAIDHPDSGGTSKINILTPVK